MIITVHPTNPGRYRAMHDDRELARGREPFLDAARVLRDEGVDPATPLIMRHAGSDTDCIVSTVGAAANLIVEEGTDGMPRFRKWRPLPFRT
jgi:hypothetical protein